MAEQTASKSVKVRELLASGMSIDDIVKSVGCTPGLVYNIRSKSGIAKKRGPGRPRKAESAVSDAGPAKRGRGRPANAASSKSAKVRELLATGMSPNDIAEKVGCTVGLVYNVKSTSGMTGKGVSKRGPGRPRTVDAPTASPDGIAGIVSMVQHGERERSRMRAALERIQGILADVLG